MNIQQAKQIPVQRIADHFGGRFSHQKGNDAWYFSPFRPDEKTASFKVNESLNTWFDFGEGRGGSTLDLWLDYYHHDRKDPQALKSALRELENLDAVLSKAAAKEANLGVRGGQTEAFKADRQPYRFKMIKQPAEIWMDSLKDEISRRRLTISTVAPYLKQAYFIDQQTQKRYNGIAFPNDKGGWEISVPNPSKGQSFKTSIGPKSLTSFIQGNSRVAVFEGFWDFLTWLQLNQDGLREYNVFILNSLSFIGEFTTQLIQSKNAINCVDFYLDNDTAGLKGLAIATATLQPFGFEIHAMNHVYMPFKDLNEYLTRRDSK